VGMNMPEEICDANGVIHASPGQRPISANLFC